MENSCSLIRFKDCVFHPSVRILTIFPIIKYLVMTTWCGFFLGPNYLQVLATYKYLRGGVPSKKGGVRNKKGSVHNNAQISPGGVGRAEGDWGCASHAPWPTAAARRCRTSGALSVT